MERLQAKCLIASAGMHLFLVFLLVVGSAFFVPKKKKNPLDSMPRLNVVPGRLVDDLLSGGGGNPNLARTDDRQKGDTLVPQPPQREAAPPPLPAPKQQKAEPKPEPLKAEPKAAVKKTGKEIPKVDPKEARAKQIIQNLQRVVRGSDTKAKQKADAEAKARADAARRAADATKAVAKAFGQATKAFSTGFKDGTKVEVGGPGGEAYANYAQFVREAFDNAWEVSPDLADEDGTVTVKVEVARDGRLISKRIVSRSGNSGLNQSVQRALDEVLSLPPFPPESKDDRRTFTIEFNLKTKRLIG